MREDKTHPLVKKLWEIIKINHISVVKLSADTGIDRAIFYRWKKGVTPSFFLFEAVVNALGYNLVLVPIKKDHTSLTTLQYEITAALEKYKSLS